MSANPFTIIFLRPVPTDHCRIFDGTIQLDPFHIARGDQLSDLNVAPFAIGEFWVVKPIACRGVVEELLDSSVSERWMSLPWRRWDIS